MRFLNPKTDFAFKKIFGSDTSREVLISFLNAVLELRHPYLIQEVDILDPYLAPKIHGMKDTYLDVRVRDENGRSYIVEMQVLNVAGFEKRILYNACKAYSNQLAAGEDYSLLSEVIALTITDFVMYEELPALKNRFRLRAEDNHEIYHGDLELIFIELPKFLKSEAELESVLDKWLYFLRSARDLTAIPAKLSDEPAIVKAFDIANKAGLTPEEMEDQERREIFIQDQRGALQFATTRALAEGAAKGMAKGLAEGLEKGLAEGLEKGLTEGLEKGLTEGLAAGVNKGRSEGKVEIAVEMLKDGEPDGKIRKYTGLTDDEIEDLRRKL